MILFHQTSFHFLGNWDPWTNFSACSETCQSNPNVTLTQRRNLMCVGVTLGGYCEPLIVNSVSYNDTWTEECHVNRSSQSMWIIRETQRTKCSKDVHFPVIVFQYGVSTAE